MSRGKWTGMILSGALLLGAAGPVLAQEGGGDSGRRRGGGEGRQNFEQMRERATQQFKDRLGASDEEWQVLQPKVDRVRTLQAQTVARGGFGFAGRRGGPRGDAAGAEGATPPANPVAEKARELQTTLENQEARPEEIKAKLQALREARAKARQDLAKAQDELRELLSVRQEAVLVSAGLLE